MLHEAQRPRLSHPPPPPSPSSPGSPSSSIPPPTFLLGKLFLGRYWVGFCNHTGQSFSPANMAEAAGLALGVLSLAGLFKDCIDLMSAISASKAMGNEYNILNTKLDLEKLRMLHWAKRVSLLGDSCDARLEDYDVKRAVFRILECIQHLLGETSILQGRYGMREARKDEIPKVASSNFLATREGAIISRPQTIKFQEDFKQLSIRLKSTETATSLIHRFRWVAQDKEKLEGLIQEISYFNARLDNLVPDLNNKGEQLIEDELSQIHSLWKLRLVFQATEGRELVTARLAQSAIDGYCRTKILGRLWFRKLDDRRLGVATAHHRTLQWSLSPESNKSDWDSLPDWFQSGEKIYWMSGKAGSGKSTLMKYVYGHSITKALLRSWAGSDKLITPHFFLYTLGTSDQQTQDGLYRGLLYQCIEADQSLIPQLLPHMWREAQGVDEPNLELPSIKEMEAAFYKLRNCSGFRFCFFIDGLDEYLGDYSQAVAFIQMLTSNPNVKVVVSSRPIPACVDAFSDSSKLSLQDLNRSDIEAYVNDRLRDHRYLQNLSQSDQEAVSSILEELVRKSSGVFLWIFLACQSLLEGFSSFDDISDLRQRVNEVPPELQHLFSHMLQKIPARYQQHAAKYLRIRYHARLIQGEDMVLQALGFALMDDNGMKITVPRLHERLTAKFRESKCRQIEGRLRSRSCGLLELSRGSVDSTLFEDYCYCGYLCGLRSRVHSRLVDSSVEFIHRTVLEYLNLPGTWQQDCLQIHDEDFDANAALASLSLILFQVQYLDGLRQESQQLLQTSLKYLRATEKSRPEIAFHMASAAESLYLSLESPSLPENGSHGKQIFLGLATEAGLVRFLQSRSYSTHTTSVPGVRRYPLLYHAIHPVYGGGLVSKMEHSVELLLYLFDTGSDPNEEFASENGKRSTPWLSWLSKMDRWARMKEFSPEDINLVASSIELFLRAGADVSSSASVLGESMECWIRNQDWEIRPPLLQAMEKALLPEAGASLGARTEHEALDPIESAVKRSRREELRAGDGGGRPEKRQRASCTL